MGSKHGRFRDADMCLFVALNFFNLRCYERMSKLISHPIYFYLVKGKIFMYYLISCMLNKETKVFSDKDSLKAWHFDILSEVHMNAD